MKDSIAIIDKRTKSTNYLQVSHQNKEKLEAYKKYLMEHIKSLNNLETIHTLVAKLNKFFQFNKINQGIVYTSKTSLMNALAVKKTRFSKDRTFLLLDLEVLDYSEKDILGILAENKLILKIWEEEIGRPPQTIENENARSVLFQYCWYKYLFKGLGCQIQFITPREDTIMSRLLKGKLSVSEVIKNYTTKEKPKPFNEQAFNQYLQNNLPSKDFVLIDFSYKDRNRFNELHLRCDLIDDICSDAIRFSLYKMILEAGTNPLETIFAPVYHDIEIPCFSSNEFRPTVPSTTTAVDLENLEGITNL